MLKEENKGMRKTIHDMLKKLISSVDKSFEFINSKFEEIMLEISEMKQRISLKEKENKVLKQVNEEYLVIIYKQ